MHLLYANKLISKFNHAKQHNHVFRDHFRDFEPEFKGIQRYNYYVRSVWENTPDTTSLSIEVNYHPKGDNISCQFMNIHDQVVGKVHSIAPSGIDVIDNMEKSVRIFGDSFLFADWLDKLP